MKAPIIDAITAVNMIRLKRPISVSEKGFFSTYFVSSGTCRVLAVRDTKANILNKAKETATLPVFTPTNLTA
jgi:hypothetical protein